MLWCLGFTLKYLNNNKKYKTKLKQSKKNGRIEQKEENGKKNYSKQMLGTGGLVLVLPSFG